MMFISAMSLFMRSRLILFAVALMMKDHFVTNAFYLQDCTTEDLDLLILADDRLTISVSDGVPEAYSSDLIDYFLSPDKDLQTRLRVAIGVTRLSTRANVFTFTSDNTTNDHVVPSLSDSPRFTFQSYKTADDVEKQVQLAPIVTKLDLYVNNTLNNTYKSQDLLEGLRQNSTHVAIVIGVRIWSHVIQRINKDDSEWGESCSFEMFYMLVGHNIKDKVLHQIAQAQTQFNPPSLKTHFYLPTQLCSLCPKISTTITSCYFLHVSKSPVTWFEASSQCDERRAKLVSVESEVEIVFLQLIINNYLEKELLEKYASSGSMDDIEYLEKLYIGLFRDLTRAGSPFLWVTGNPMVYLHWIDQFPNGGPDERCGLWLFSKTMEWSESLGKTVHNSSNLEMNFDGWDDIGCGSRTANIALCEIQVGAVINYNSLKAPPANETSFTSAVSRGEFSVYHDEIVSIPLLVRDSTYSSFLEQEELSFKVFSCDDSGYTYSAIPYSHVCDHIQHCDFGRDENVCKYRTCNKDTEFKCDSGQCVPLESRCDVYTDCYDGTDEDDCRFCNSAMCCDGSCIPRHFVYNGEVECITCDESENDENVHNDPRGHDCPFVCNRSECVTPSMLNDNITQCLGPDGPLDKIWGKLETVNSCKISFEFNGSLIEFERWSPRCVYIKDRYGTVIGCRDMSHLHDCQNFTCPEGYVKCPDSYCIPIHLVNDGHSDCPHREDEFVGRSPPTCKGNFKCSGERVGGGKVCVHPDLVCDGYPHCPSGDDELNCHVSCAEGFRCIGGTVTVTDFDKSKPLQDLSFIDERSRYIDLSGVNLSAIVSVGNEEQFQNVVELYVSNCQIGQLDGNTLFKFSLNGVYALDLSYNLISILSGNILIAMDNLHILNLSHNRLLTSIPHNEWNSLEQLNLAFTAVSTVKKVILYNFRNLRYLNLSFTHISRIDQKSFPIVLSLTILDLRGTPLSKIEPNVLTSVSVSKDLYSDFYKLCCPQVRGQGIPEHVCHAPVSAISSCMDLIQEPPQRVLLWTVGVLAVTGNLVVITYRLLWDRTVLKKSYGLFVTNLSVSDLFMGVYLLIIAGTDVIYRDNYVWYESDWRHSTLCQTAGFLSTFSSETSAFFILLVTIDRFLVIRFPFGHFRFNKRSMLISCVIAWSVGFVLALVPALPRFQHWQMYSSNGMCLGLPLTPVRRPGWEYSAALFIGLNFLLFLFIACGQYLIYSAMSENSLKTSSAAQSNAKRVQEIMVAKQLSLVVLSDFLCWFPIGIMGLLAMSGRDIGTEVYAWSAVLVLPINSALNPVLYTVPVIMKKWEDFKSGNSKSEIRTSFRSSKATCETVS